MTSIVIESETDSDAESASCNTQNDSDAESDCDVDATSETAADLLNIPMSHVTLVGKRDIGLKHTYDLSIGGSNSVEPAFTAVRYCRS